jgi:hypothetical protein
MWNAVDEDDTIHTCSSSSSSSDGGLKEDSTFQYITDYV